MDQKIKKVVEKFLISWKKKNWKKMLRYTQITWRASHKNNAQQLKWWFGAKPLIELKIVKTETVGDACKDVYIEINYGKGTKKIKARVICEITPYKPDMKGSWGVNPVSCLKEI